MEIQWQATAVRAGVTVSDLNALLEGRATATVAKRFGVTMSDIESFLNGDASANVAKALGFDPQSAAKDLGAALGVRGAAGYLIALLVSRKF